MSSARTSLKRTFVDFKLPTSERPNLILHGDTRDLLKLLPDETFQCVITSPPYWGVRDYGVENQIGAEADLEEYIENLVEVFRQVRRTLKHDGTLWLNIGNTYTSGGRKWRASDSKNRARAMSYRPPTPAGLKKKDLIGVAWKLALACQEDGWFLRNDIVWNKPNCQPESVKDRLTVSHEYLFLLTKSERYLFNQEPIREVTSDGQGVRNRRTVWNVNTEPFPESHFAVFPPALVRPCVLAGSSEGDLVLDPFFGAGTVGLVSKELGRLTVGLEISEEYVQIAESRIMNSVQLRLIQAE